MAQTPMEHYEEPQIRVGYTSIVKSVTLDSGGSGVFKVLATDLPTDAKILHWDLCGMANSNNTVVVIDGQPTLNSTLTTLSIYIRGFNRVGGAWSTGSISVRMNLVLSYNIYK